MFTSMAKFNFDDEQRDVSTWLDGNGRTVMTVLAALLGLLFLVYVVAGLFQ